MNDTSSTTVFGDWSIEGLRNDVTASNAVSTLFNSTKDFVSVTGSLVVVVQSTAITTPSPTSSTVLLLVNVTSSRDYYWTTAAVTDESEQINTALLWLPYVIFTIVLLGLIAVSFLRFHCERGNQYRRRQAEISDKLQHGNVQDSLRLLPTSGQEAEMMTSLHLGGGVSLMPGPAFQQQPNGFGPTKDGIPQHMNLFVQYSQVNQGNKLHEDIAEHDDEDDTCQIVSLEESGKHRRRHQQYEEDTSKTDSKNKKLFFFGGKDSQRKGGSTGGGGSRRPIVFTFNCNGSMVDVRCGQEERQNTFRLSGLSYLSADDPLGEGYEFPTQHGAEGHRGQKSGNKQLVAQYTKSRSHLHSSGRNPETVAPNPRRPVIGNKINHQNTLPPLPPITNGLTPEPSKRLVKNRSLDMPPPPPPSAAIFDLGRNQSSKMVGVSHPSNSPLFTKYSNPSTIVAPSSTPLIFSQSAFTKMHVTSVNMMALSSPPLTSPNPMFMNLNPAILNPMPSVLNLPPSSDTTLGNSFNRPYDISFQQFVQPQVMFDQHVFNLPSSITSFHHQQRQLPTLLQSPTSESVQQDAINQQLMMQMHMEQNLLQQRLQQNKQQVLQFQQQPSSINKQFFDTRMLDQLSSPYPLSKPQHHCQHQQPKSSELHKSQQQLSVEIDQQLKTLQQQQQPQIIKTLHQLQTQQPPTKIPTQRALKQQKTDQAAGHHAVKRHAQSQVTQQSKHRLSSQDTPRRSRSTSKTVLPSNLAQQPQTQHVRQMSETTFASSLAHQPFFSTRRQHNKNAQTVFAANRAPLLAVEKRSRESEIENEALLLWQKQL